MAAEEEQKEAEPKPKSKKMLIIIILAVVLLGGVGAGAYFKFMKASGDAPEEKKPEEISFYEMDTLMVNLADQGGKRFLKASIKFKLNSTAVGEECKAHTFQIKDLVLMLLSSKESEEIFSKEDKIQLKKQILEAVNQVLTKGEVLDVYFTDFLIQ